MRVVFGILVLCALLALPRLALGFGLSYDYMENNTMELHAGERYDFKIGLQNNDDQEAVINVSVTSDIAALTGPSDYTIPAKNYDQFAHILVQVPSDAPVGTVYPIGISVGPTGPRPSGQVPFAVRYDRQFWVRVIPGPAQMVTGAAPLEKQQAGVVQGGWGALLGNQLLTVIIVIIIGGAILGLLWRRSSISARRKDEQHGEQIAQSGPPQWTSAPDQPAATVTPPAAAPTSVAPTIPVYAPPQASPQDTLPKPPTSSRLRERAAPAGQEFVLVSGERLRTLGELAEALPRLEEWQFAHHVNRERNDFSNWIEHSLQLPDVARAVTAAHTRKEMTRALTMAMA